MVTAHQVSAEPVASAKSDRAARPSRKAPVAMKNRALIHMIAVWLEIRYFRKNTCSARARSPWYKAMLARARAVDTARKTRKGFHAKPIAARPGTVSSRMALS
jgi:hypothetical protein